MSFAQAFRGPTADGDLGWRARCQGFPAGSCLAIISAHKPSGLCNFCERSKAQSEPQIRLECGLPLARGSGRCEKPIGHLHHGKPKHKQPVIHNRYHRERMQRSGA